ncbi:MBL fold metallo-hydrolase [bacterium]|nr:MBL fold metallo-hydrolase [bacterium]
MGTQIKKFSEIAKGDAVLPSSWDFRAVVNDDNLTYFVWNTQTQEGLIVDPARDDLEAIEKLLAELKSVRWFAVIDTHTHADHISSAFELSSKLGVPLLMSSKSPSTRVQLRVSQEMSLPLKAAPIHFAHTPGHTPDGLLVSWGPFLFTGDTILYGDTGRDDLPGGDPSAHYESLQVFKKVAKADALVLFGHDSEGGRVTTWKTQLQMNASLTQDRETFVREASAFVGAAPKKLKESLYENLK